MPIDPDKVLKRFSTASVVPVSKPTVLKNPKEEESGLDFLLNAAGLDRAKLAEHATAGLMERPGFEPEPGFANKAAFYAGKYGPAAAGATLGTALGPGGTAMGAAIGAGAGAMLGRSMQNLGQTISNEVTPGSAAQKSDLEKVLEPATDAVTQGAMAGASTAGMNALRKPAVDYVAGMTGVKPNLVERTIGNIGKIFKAESVERAGEEISKHAAKAGIQTGTDGYKLATASLLGKKAATDEFSTATTMEMARLAREGMEAMTPQELYSTAEGLRKAISAPKFADPHGPFAQNYRMYTQQLAQIEDRLEKVIPGYAEKRAGYANALAKEAFSSASPLNKNMSSSQLKLMAATPQALLGVGGLIHGKKNDNAAEMMLSAALLSPLLVGKAMQATAFATRSQVPQVLGRTAGAAGSKMLSDALTQKR